MKDEDSNLIPDTSRQVNAAARFFDEHHITFRKMIACFVHDEHEREEVFQDLFVYFVRKPMPADVKNAEGWIYTTILDRVRDRYRRQARYQARLQAYADIRAANTSPATGQLPDEAELEAVFAAIRTQLTAKEAEAVTYKYKQGLSIKEIARRMRVKDRTVSHYLAYGMRKIKALFGQNRDCK